MIPSPLVQVLLVVNSFASSVTARTTVIVHRILDEHHDVALVETGRRGHATRFAQDAARRGVDVVIAFGGDGTLNEVATGVAGSSTALGVIPGGSTNVFARTIGLPNDPVAAAPLVAAGLSAGAVRRIGLGRVNGRYFCFHSGVGIDAAVVRTVEERAAMKRWLGHPLFVTAALRNWFGGYRRQRFTVSAPDRSTDSMFTVVLNTDPYTYLGNRPLHLSTSAGLDRPLVAVSFRSLDTIPVLRALFGALRSTGAPMSADLIEWRDLDELTITSDMPVPYQVDGDYLGESANLHFEYIADAVGLVTPISAARPGR